MSTIKEIQVDAYNCAVEHGFFHKDLNPYTALMLMVGELSEAAEELRKGHAPDYIYIENGKPEGLPIELADCVLRILNFAEHFGIDMEKAIFDKATFNWTRPYKHGGKTV